MQIVSAVFGFIIIMAAIITFIWMIIGIPAAVILTVVYFVSHNKEQKKKFKRWIKICLLSIIVMICIGILWGIFMMLGQFFGIQMNPVVK